MNRRIVLALGLLGGSLLGTGCGDDVKNGAVRLTIRYSGFVPGCVRVHAEDAKAASNSDEQTLTAANTTFDGQLVVAVFREKSWSRDLKLTVTAHEQSCTGAPVATQTATAAVTPGKITETTTQLTATDADGDGWIAPANGGTDCADDASTRFPGATEACNLIDEDCDGEVDEGAPLVETWVDGDGDGFGTGTPISECTVSAGRAVQAGDCNDGNGQVFPDAPERCDGIDNNCNGQNNETFDVNGACDPAGACVAGHLECIADGGTTCVEEPPSWFADLDRDDSGRMDGGIAACEAPAGYVASAMDCDDGDPFTNASLPEICDRRDNNCNATVDEGGACGSGDGGWFNGFIGDASDQWETVATVDRGWHWIAGSDWSGSVDNGNILMVVDGGMTSRDTACAPSKRWTGSWAERRGDAGVLLVGGCAVGSGSTCETGLLALVDSTTVTCTPRGTMTVPDRVKGVVGIRAPTGFRVFAVGSGGVAFEANVDTLQPSSPQPLSGVTLNDIHGVDMASIYAVGTETTPNNPKVFRLQETGASQTWVSEQAIDDLAASLSGEFFGVWVVHPDLVYVVGSNGVVMKKERGTWSQLPQVASGATVRSVRAFGTSSVYVTAGDDVWRFSGASWQRVYTGDGNGMLTDISGTRPDDLIVVGDELQVGYSRQ